MTWACRSQMMGRMSEGSLSKHDYECLLHSAGPGGVGGGGLQDCHFQSTCSVEAL